MPQIIPLIKSVVGFNAMDFAQLGEITRVIDRARTSPLLMGMGSADQAISDTPRLPVTRAAYLYFGELGMDLAMPDDHSVSERSSYAEHALINRSPRLQWTGHELTTRKIALKLHSSLCDVDVALSWLESMRLDHVPVPIVMGTGVFLGHYVLAGMERREICYETTAIKYVDVTLELKEYVPTPEELLRMMKPKALATNSEAMPGITRVDGVLRSAERSPLRIAPEDEL